MLALVLLMYFRKHSHFNSFNSSVLIQTVESHDSVSCCVLTVANF